MKISALTKRLTAILAILAIAGCFVCWVWPVHFGLSLAGEDPFQVTSVVGFAPVGNSVEQPANDYSTTYAFCNVYTGVVGLDRLVPASNPNGPIPLTAEQLNAITPHLPKPQYHEIDLTPLNHLNNQIGGIWLNSELRSWVNVINFLAWSDRYHRFLDHSIQVYRNINPYVEGRIRDSKITLRMTVISKGDKQNLIQSPDLPPGVNHYGLGKYEMDYGIGEFPVDQDGIYAFKVKALRESDKTFTDDALVVFEIHPPPSPPNPL